MARVQYPYECLAMGHESGSRTFYAAPPEWFVENKMHGTPKNCPACKAWTRAQVDEQKTCACGTSFRIPHRYKISYYKKIGPYTPDTECGSCREGNRPPKGMDDRPSRKEIEEQQKKERPSEFASLAMGLALSPRVILTEGEYYTKVVPFRGESLMEHLGHHVPGSPYDQTTHAAAAASGLPSTKSPSSFASGTSVEGLLANASQLLQMEDSANVRDYQDGRRLVRVTFTGDHDRLEVSILDPQPGDVYGLVTTYDNVTVEDIRKQKWYNG